MTVIVGVIGPEPHVAIAAISRQLVGDGGTTSSARLVYHHDASRDVLYVGLPWQAQDAAGLKAALLLFLSCHAIVWVHPAGAAPDARTLGTLRLLQQSKQLLLPSLPELLALAPGAEAGSPSSDACLPWGQPPLLLFLCETAPGAGGPLPPQQRQQAQQHLDSRLRGLVKRCRVLLPEEQPAALCTLRSQSTVWLLGRLSQGPECAVRQAFAALREPQGGAVEGDSAVSSLAGAQRGGAGAVTQQLQAPAASAEGGPGEGEDAGLLGLLRLALQEHGGSLARAPGAGVGAGGVSLPTWRPAVSALAAALQCSDVTGIDAAAARGTSRQEQQQEQQVGDKPGGGARVAGRQADGTVPDGAAAVAAWLAGCTSLARQISESKCQRAVAAARDAYLRAVPGVYPAAVHDAAVKGALRLFASLARGPASLDAQGRLRAELEALWRDGRQQCQDRSLWDRPCILAPHDPQEVPHSSGAFYRLATPDGQAQVTVADPFPPPPGSPSLSLAPPIQPRPYQGPGQQHQQADAGAGTGAEASAAASLLVAVPLLVRQEGGESVPGQLAAPAASTSHQPHLPTTGTAASSTLAGSICEALAPSGQQAQQAAAGAPSGCYLEVHVLGTGKAAQGGQLLQPGLLAGGSSLHRFVLQVSRPEDEPEEEFPALGPAQPEPSAAPAVPKLLNWPGAPAAALAPAPLAQAAGRPAAGLAGQPKKGKKGPLGRAGAKPPALLVGIEYESLLGHRVIITPAQLAACTASSLDPVRITSGGAEEEDGGGVVPPCPMTDALADAAAEAIGAAAAAAAAAKRATAAGAAASALPAAAMGGPAAELMLASSLPLYLRCSVEQLGGGGGARHKGPKEARTASKAGHAAEGGALGPGDGGMAWWQLRRVFVATPPGDLLFQACPLLRLELPALFEAPVPASSSSEATSARQQQQQQERRPWPGGTLGAPGGGRSAAAAALLYQPQQAVQLPADSLCCIALPWIYTLPPAATAGPDEGPARGAALPATAGGAGGEAQGPSFPLLGGMPASAAVPLPLVMGPLRAMLVGGTALRPEGWPG